MLISLEWVSILIIFYNLYEEGTTRLYTLQLTQTVFWNLTAKILNVNINCPCDASQVNLFTLESYSLLL